MKSIKNKREFTHEERIRVNSIMAFAVISVMGIFMAFLEGYTAAVVSICLGLLMDQYFSKYGWFNG